MKFPDEFKTLAFQMICLYEREIDTEEGIRAGLMRVLTSQEKRRLARFLAEILDGRCSDADLDALWNATGTDIIFARPAATRNFLVMVREWLARSEAS